jgi:hypothetical protein
VRTIAIGVSALALMTAEQPGPIKVRVDAVTIDALVTDGRAPIRGLGPDDFELTDRGVQQIVERVETESIPLRESFPLVRSPGRVVVQRRSESLLEELVVGSGGRILNAGNQSTLERAFRAIVEEFKQQYLVTYYPAGVTPEGWHDVEVRVKRRGRVHVQARKGYHGG